MPWPFLHTNISMHIHHTVLYAFPKVVCSHYSDKLNMQTTFIILSFEEHQQSIASLFLLMLQSSCHSEPLSRVSPSPSLLQTVSISWIQPLLVALSPQYFPAVADDLLCVQLWWTLTLLLTNSFCPRLLVLTKLCLVWKLHSLIQAWDAEFLPLQPHS